MRLARAHVGWGLAASLLLHVTALATLTLALPRLQVRPGVIRRDELEVVQAAAAPPPAAAQSLQPTAAVELSVEPATAEPGVPVAMPAPNTPPQPPKPKPAHKLKPKPEPALAPHPEAVTTTTPKLQNPAHADPRSDGSALERVLRQIAATTELTQDERRRAMLVVLRTWEDPSGKHSADELIEALLRNVRKARITPQTGQDGMNEASPPQP